MSDQIPEDLRYTKDHEWLRLDGDHAIVGITAFAAEQLGDVVMVELPEEGDEFERGETFGSVESTKAVSDLYAPITGVVVRVNTPLNDSPEYVNEDPYEEGWMIELEIKDREELDELMDAEAYAAHVAESE